MIKLLNGDYLRRKDMVKDIFSCVYYGGGGTEYDGGLWRKKEMPKMIIFKQLKESFFQPNWTEIKVKKETLNTNRGDKRYHGFGNVLIDEEDGTYTAYPDQCGTPHIFNPIAPELIESVIQFLSTEKEAEKVF